MSGVDDIKGHEQHVEAHVSLEDIKGNEQQVKFDAHVDNIKGNERQVKSDVHLDSENTMPTPQEEVAILKNKYGGILPKKQPLISKDHERAYFDSADWALGKQGGAEKLKGGLLRPKLQPTQQPTRYRKSPYAPSDGEDVNSPDTTETIE